MKKRTLFYVKNPGGDIVLSKETGAEAYRILRSNCAFRTFPKINWGIMYKLVPECDYIDESEWERFIYTGFLKSLKDDTTVEWDTNNGIGYTWYQMAAKINLNDDTVVVATYKE